jgi:hypothetical protein
MKFIEAHCQAKSRELLHGGKLEIGTLPRAGDISRTFASVSPTSYLHVISEDSAALNVPSESR